jgi:hypothetical protein
MNSAQKMKQTLEILPPCTRTRILPIGRTEDGQSYSIVAEVPMGGGVTGDTEGERLARLFCAAPDLLDALRALVNGDVRISNKRDGMLSEHCPKVIAARAAISKATQP